MTSEVSNQEPLQGLNRLIFIKPCSILWRERLSEEELFRLGRASWNLSQAMAELRAVKTQLRESINIASSESASVKEKLDMHDLRVKRWDYQIRLANAYVVDAEVKLATIRAYTKHPEATFQDFYTVEQFEDLLEEAKERTSKAVAMCYVSQAKAKQQRQTHLTLPSSIS